jgi:hypothetical protein
MKTHIAKENGSKKHFHPSHLEKYNGRTYMLRKTKKNLLNTT